MGNGKAKWGVGENLRPFFIRSEGGETMNKRPYAGKIENKGAMQVKAPIAQKAVKKPTVKSGGDLRCGKSGK